jgi:hypothetical protein
MAFPNWIEIQNEWFDAHPPLANESDRAVALIAAAHIDAALEILLKASLGGDKKLLQKLLDGPHAPIGNLSSRIAISHSLGHFGARTYKTLEAIRKVRNEFAHSKANLTFKDGDIKSIILDRFSLPYVLPYPAPDLSRMRERFIWTTASSLSRIGYAISTSHQPAMPEDS